MKSYADTSFLVSLYILDANSVQAAAHMSRATLPVLITTFGELELLNAISLRVFRKELGARQAKAARSLIASDLQQGVLDMKPLPPAVFERAKQISRRRTPRFGTRTLDVLHVAITLLLQAKNFYTFDRNQGRLASAEGLTVL
ncbi:MAG: type II toxin-antitoxin system VapC family toxin [Candidatus Acidiferrales bacterium]